MIPLIPWRPSNRDDALLPAKREGPIAFWSSSGVCVGCCLGEDANLAAASLAQGLFSRPRGRRPPRGRRRHTMAVGALVPPDATRVAIRVTLALQQCTQVPQNGSERSFLPICVHSCVPTSVHNVATVYTNAPKRLREAVFVDLCTLLRPHDRSRDRVGSWVPRHRRPHGSCDARALGSEAHAARAVTRPPTRTHEASLLAA